MSTSPTPVGGLSAHYHPHTVSTSLTHSPQRNRAPSGPGDAALPTTRARRLNPPEPSTGNEICHYSLHREKWTAPRRPGGVSQGLDSEDMDFFGVHLINSWGEYGIALLVGYVLAWQPHRPSDQPIRERYELSSRWWGGGPTHFPPQYVAVPT
jgi:hypothetical protein